MYMRNILTALLVLVLMTACGEDNTGTETKNSPPATGDTATAGEVEDGSDTGDRKASTATNNPDALAAAKEMGIPQEDIVLFSDVLGAYPADAHGIDISHHQGEVDWQAVEAVGVGFVFVKATEGVDYIDPMFERNWAELQKTKIRHGAYHMFRPEDDELDQARNFVTTLQKAGIDAGAMPPVLDIESVSTIKQVPHAELHERSVGWLRLVEQELGIKPMVYTNPTFWREYLTDEHELTNYELWISEYDMDADAPKETGAWHNWSIWQFSRYGIVDGVPKPVDFNRLSPSASILRSGQ
jgi:lysozyme